MPGPFRFEPRGIRPYVLRAIIVTTSKEQPGKAKQWKPWTTPRSRQCRSTSRAPTRSSSRRPAHWGTISIRHGADLTRFLHEGCRYAYADQIRPENFSTLTFAELHGVDLGPWSCSGLDISIRWILDDLLELLIDSN